MSFHLYDDIGRYLGMVHLPVSSKDEFWPALKAKHPDLVDRVENFEPVGAPARIGA